MADELGLPKASLQKAIKELLPADMRLAGDAGDLLVQCCNQFVHLLSTQANDISERDKRTTISPEHVIKALEELEFGEAYTAPVRAAWDEWKVENKEHHGRLGAKKQASGLTQEQLIELQHKLFEEARAATLSGPLPSLVAADAMALAAVAAAAQPAQQQQQQQQQAPGEQQQAAPPQQEQAAPQQGEAREEAAQQAPPVQQLSAEQAPAQQPAGDAPAAAAAAAPAAAGDEQGDDALSDTYSGSSQLV